MDSLKIYGHYAIHILLASAIVILLLVRPCVNVVQRDNVEIIKIDTIHDIVYRDTQIFIKVHIPVPQIKEVYTIDTIYQDSIIYIDTTSQFANVYQDSIDQDHGIIYWTAATTGELLALDAHYHGSIMERIIYRDREVTKYKGQLLLTSGIGYNGDNVRGVAGLEFITKKGKKYGYEYDFVNGFHSFTTGLRLF